MSTSRALAEALVSANRVLKAKEKRERKAEERDERKTPFLSCVFGRFVCVLYLKARNIFLFAIL